jgi:hypothetical protein
MSLAAAGIEANSASDRHRHPSVVQLQQILSISFMFPHSLFGSFRSPTADGLSIQYIDHNDTWDSFLFLDNRLRNPIYQGVCHSTSKFWPLRFQEPRSETSVIDGNTCLLLQDLNTDIPQSPGHFVVFGHVVLVSELESKSRRTR